MKESEVRERMRSVLQMAAAGAALSLASCQSEHVVPLYGAWTPSQLDASVDSSDISIYRPPMPDAPGADGATPDAGSDDDDGGVADGL
jgi:aryl-alcohol dehydrogenase-like predicted oxidoreductase